MMNVHGIRRNVKNVVKNYTTAQIKVREATSNDPWGPSGTLMSEISDLTYNVVAFSEIMYVIWKRLNDHGKNWKHVYKALVLMEYLLKSGSEKVAQQCKERMFVIETLKDFQYIEENKDQGVNVREKAKQLVALLKDDERLKDERVRALKARERFAQATAGVRREFIQQDQNSTEFTPGAPFNQEFMPEGIFVSELEQVRPQTIGEEELQLQLALAMSKEEADQSERLKRNDELRLQMALSESKESFEQSSQPSSDSKETEHSAMQDLIDIFSNNQGDQPTVTRDPWGMPIEPADRRRYPHSYTLPSGLNQNAFPACENANPNMSAACGENNNPVNLNATLHSPDVTSPAVIDPGLFDMSSLRKSLSADIAVNNFSQQRNTSPQRFLGDNANLVNLDSLIEFRAPAASALTSSPNPFQAVRPSPPSINEIRVQNNSTTTPSNLYTLQRPVNQTLTDTTAMPSNNPFL